MPETLSTTTMIKRLEGLLGTKDLSDTEAEFVEKLVGIVDAGQVTKLSEKQVAYLSGLHRRHFA